MINMKNVVTVVVILLFSVQISAQLELPAASPLATAYQKVGTTDVTIKYSSPGVKDRTIWGELVPYDKLWRTGANMATWIEFSTDVKVEGAEVKAGKYGLFTIPGKDEWTVILNSAWEMGGTSNYKEEEDVLRFKVKPQENHYHERMLINITFNEPTISTVALEWENLKVPFKIESHLSDASSKEVRSSPKSMVHKRVGLTDVTVTYGSPGVKGRTIFGDLVPYDKIWRAGANEATTIELSTDAKVGGKDIPAGKYSLFTIPAEGDWTVIINKVADQWGAYNYHESQDVTRFAVTPTKGDHSHERMKFGFSKLTDNSVHLVLAWADLMVPIPIEVDVKSKALENIEKALKEAKDDDWVIFAQSANFAVENDMDLENAQKWIDKSISVKSHYWNNWIKGKIHYAMGDMGGAKKACEDSRKAGEESPENFANFESNVAELEAKLK
jgi:hypothetical protein